MFKGGSVIGGYLFPFGKQVNRLEQQDRTPKDVFVLGVYPSAVHAKWIRNKTTICQALAVANEPYIFWNGKIKDTKAILESIEIPGELGCLVPADNRFNGASSKVLDEHILKPLGINRNITWLCDLLPETRLNDSQYKVIETKYNPLIRDYGLNEVTIPKVPASFCTDLRRKEITKEIKDSRAKKLILLGDAPIKQYLNYVADTDFNGLKDYIIRYGYGKPYKATIDGYIVDVIPFSHPRQIGSLSREDKVWHNEHKKWESVRI